MAIKFATTWGDPTCSELTVIYNLGLLTASVENPAYTVPYILSKIQELYTPLKSKGTPDVMQITPEGKIVDELIRDIIRLAESDSPHQHDDWMNWPIINGPRKDLSVPQLKTIVISRGHLEKAFLHIQRYLK